MPIASAARIQSPPSRFRFTVQQYHRMIESGILHEDEQIELIEGELATRTWVNAAHAGKTKRLTHLLSNLAGDEAIVSVKNPLVLGDSSEPQPDLMLLHPRADFYETANPLPEDVLLLIEVADTSLEYDRGVKIHPVCRQWHPGGLAVRPAAQTAGDPSRSRTCGLPEDTVA